MKIVPAHSVEAELMADSLYEEWVAMGIPLNSSLANGQEVEPTVPVVRERMAIAFGWESWGDMIDAVSQPHAPIYIDDAHDKLELLVLNLSQSIGYDYAHGFVWRIVENAGLGFSPEKRRALQALASPWGQIQERKTIAVGIEEVSTSGHGGIILSEQRCIDMPNHLSLGSPYYEEDCEARLIELAHPDLFRDHLKYALASIEIYSLDGLENEQPDELEVVAYLAKCVFHNRKPIKTPTTRRPSLRHWTDCLATCPRVDNSIPMTSKRWKSHFFPHLPYE